ncbi:MAG: hypothetical protein AB7Q00_07225 [Phycisphaerales bacterium]
MESQSPTFEEWRYYCFTQAWEDFSGNDADSWEVGIVRQERFLNLEVSLLATYMTRLFESPNSVVEEFTDNQIAKATWFLFGTGSEYIKTVRDSQIPVDLQSGCIRSIATMYTNLFDRVCGNRGSDPDSQLYLKHKIDGAVYMIWDMDNLAGTVMFPDKAPHLVEPGVHILETALLKCRTSACRISALHGIGHIVSVHRAKKRRDIAPQLQSFIEKFLERDDVPSWLREYADCAYHGSVQ